MKSSISFRWKTFVSLGLVVIGTFTVIWLPVLKHNPSAVIKRLFPFERGLFEVKRSFTDPLNKDVSSRTKWRIFGVR